MLIQNRPPISSDCFFLHPDAVGKRNIATYLEVYRNDVHAEFDGDGDWLVIEVFMPLDGFPIRDRLHQYVANLFPDHRLGGWWVKQDHDEF